MEASKLTDAAIVTLVKRCKNNDGDAYNELLNYYENYLYRLCYSFTRSRDESLDMMQKVYIKTFKAIKDFDETRPLLPWLKRITINTLINHTKSNKRFESSLEGDWKQEQCSSKGPAPAEYLSSKDDPEGIVVLNDIHRVIDELIAELPDRYRLALALRYYEEMSYEQIAAILKQPLGTVKIVSTGPGAGSVKKCWPVASWRCKEQCMNSTAHIYSHT